MPCSGCLALQWSESQLKNRFSVSWCSLKVKINFIKNNMASKVENPTQTFREKVNLVLQLIEELQIKSKTVMSVGACERKKFLFFNIYFFRENFFYYLYFFSIYSILNKLHDLLPHCSNSTTCHQEYMILCPHSLD